MLLVLDGQGSIFGAFSGDAWRVDKHYYGNGESFLFTVHPQFKVYPWTRANDHFVLASHDCIAFGSDDAAWRRFAAEPFEMWALTSSLYRVEPSDGVHVTAKANAVYSHLLATHLLRTVLPQRAVY